MRRTEIPRNRRRQALLRQLLIWNEETNGAPAAVSSLVSVAQPRRHARGSVVPVRDMGAGSARIDRLIEILDGLYMDRADALRAYAENGLVSDVASRMRVSLAKAYDLWNSAVDLLDVMNEVIE